MRTFDDQAQQPGIEPFASEERRIIPSPLEFVRVPQVGLDEVRTEGKYPGPRSVELTFRIDREIDPVAQTFLGDAWVVSLPQQDLLVQQPRMPARGCDERLGERDVGSARSVDGQPAPLLVGQGVVALNLHVEDAIGDVPADGSEAPFFYGAVDVVIVGFAKWRDNPGSRQVDRTDRPGRVFRSATLR